MFTVNPLSQNDPAWKSKRLGFDNSNTIGKWGCLLTCLAMVADRYGYDETPLSLNDKLKALGPNVGFMGALVIPASLRRAASQAAFPQIHRMSQFTGAACRYRCLPGG